MASQFDPKEAEARFYDHLRTGDTKAALSALTEDLAELPQYKSAVIQTLEQSDDIEEAIVHTKKLVALKPDKPRIYNTLGRLLFKAGRFEEFHDYLAEALSLIEERHWPLLFQQLTNQTTPATTFGALEEAYRRAESPQVRSALTAHCALAALDTGNIDAARAYLEMARGQAVENAFVRLAQVRLLVVSHRFDEAFRTARDSLEAYPDDADLQEARIELASQTGRFEKFFKFINDLLTSDRHRARALTYVDRFYRPREIVERILSRVNETGAADAITQNPGLLMRLTLTAGDTERAVRIAQQSTTLKGISRNEAFETYCTSMPLEKSSRLSEDTVAEIEIARHPEAVATLICFSGHKNNYYGLPNIYFDKLLEKYPLNVMYITDTLSLGMGFGLKSLSDSYQGTLQAIAELAEKLGPVPVMTLGASMGGLHAVRLADVMDVRVCLSFSGPTFIHTTGQDMPRVRQLTRKHLYLTSTMAPEDADIRWVLEKHRRLKLFYVAGTGNQYDMESYQHVADLPNCKPHLLEGFSEHNSLIKAILDHKFDILMQRAINKTVSSRN